MAYDSDHSAVRALIPLGHLAAGEAGAVVAIEGDPQFVARLHEMGLRPGCRVRMVRPGSACIVMVESQRFAFRGDEAAVVMVQLVSPVSVGS